MHPPAFSREASAGVGSDLFLVPVKMCSGGSTWARPGVEDGGRFVLEGRRKRLAAYTV